MVTVYEPHCARCGYDLTGLQAGDCPECGQRFDPQTGRGLGPPLNDPGVKIRFWFNRLRTVAMVLFGVLILGCSGLLSTLAAKPEKLIALGVLGLITCIFAAIVSFVYERESR